MVLKSIQGSDGQDPRPAIGAPQTVAGTAGRRGTSFRLAGLALLASVGGCVLLTQVAGMSPVPRNAALRVVSHTVSSVKPADLVRFEVVFDRAPDFLSLDGAGRQADSFQFHLDALPGSGGLDGSSPYPWECIVRGEEIHVKGDIRIRDHLRGPSDEPGSGGWGPIVGGVPFKLDGARLRFEVPYSVLGTTTGDIGYSLEVYERGASAGEWSGTSTPLEEPAIVHTAPSKTDPVQASLWGSPIPTWHDSNGLVTPDAMFRGFLFALFWPVVALTLGVYIVGARAIGRRQAVRRDRRERESRTPGFIGGPMGRRIARRARTV